MHDSYKENEDKLKYAHHFFLSTEDLLLLATATVKSIKPCLYYNWISGCLECL